MIIYTYVKRVFMYAVYNNICICLYIYTFVWGELLGVTVKAHSKSIFYIFPVSCFNKNGHMGQAQGRLGRRGLLLRWLPLTGLVADGPPAQASLYGCPVLREPLRAPCSAHNRFGGGFRPPPQKNVYNSDRQGRRGNIHIRSTQMWIFYSDPSNILQGA